VKVVASVVNEVLLHELFAVWHSGVLALTAKPQTLLVPTAA